MAALRQCPSPPTTLPLNAITNTTTTNPKPIHIKNTNRFARATIRFGRLRMILPNGEERFYGDGSQLDPPVPAGHEWRGLPRRAAVLRVLSMDMFRKIVVKHDVGMGEAYMDGDFVADDLGVRREAA